MAGRSKKRRRIMSGKEFVGKKAGKEVEFQLPMEATKYLG
jgi:hypothetical protein